jgi:NAD(P)H-hydrate repair Nnr-like enzyme with NAD(P)H-hydrate dehydratase domain
VGKRSLLDDGKNVCIHTEHRMEKKSFFSSAEKERKERPKKNKKKSMQAFLNKKE